MAVGKALDVLSELGWRLVNEYPDHVWRIGNWQVYPDLGEISRDGRPRKLDPRAMRLLMFLAERPGQVIGLRELLDSVWTNAVVTPHSVYEAVAALREALGDSPDKPAYIVTLPRRGYRLIAPVEHHGQAEHSPTVNLAAVDTASQDKAPVPPHSRRTGIVLLAVVIALAAVLAVAWITRDARAPAGRLPVDKSIAVLPFTDLSEKKDQEYFADGLAEELLGVLVNVPGLRVIGRTSSFQYKNKNDDVRSIGAKLGAAYVVEGSVRRVGSRIRVATQLIRAVDGVHQWSATYDRNAEDTLQLESELATSLGRALELSVSSIAALNQVETNSADANEHYLRGLHALDAYTHAGALEAANQFQAAIALDPQFTAAYVSLGMAHYVEAAFSFVPPDAGFPRVREDALKAVKLNSKSAIAHALLARVATLYSWDWPEAQRESDTAVALEPQNSFVLYAAADLASVLGDFERAERLFRESLVSDPLNPETHFMLAVVLTAEARLDEAEAEVRRCLAISPTYVFGHYLLGYILTAAGREEAIAECTHETPEGGQMTCLAEAYYARGRSKEATASLQQAIQVHSSDHAFWIASVFAYVGQADRAFEWLDRAYRQKEPVLQYIKSTPEFSNLRGDPRYKAFLSKMRLPE